MLGAAYAGAAVCALSLFLGSAYTSSATGPRGGEGAAAVSGYAISGVRFLLGGGAGVRAVDFRLSPANARTVRVELSAGGPWATCSVSRGSARCPLPLGTSVASVGSLSVVASS